jgi:hypothetical protein
MREAVNFVSVIKGNDRYVGEVDQTGQNCGKSIQV